jgi:hypothetical protein
MPIPRGAHYIATTNRRNVRLATGATVTRQQAENMFAQSVGARSDYHLRQMAKTERGSKAASGINKVRGHKTDSQRARDTGLYSQKELRGLAIVLANEPRDSRGQIANKAPDSPLVQYLQATGRIASGEQYAAGDSPSLES